MKKGHYSLINTLYSVMYAKTINMLGKTCIFFIKLISANFSQPNILSLKYHQKKSLWVIIT